MEGATILTIQRNMHTLNSLSVFGLPNRKIRAHVYFLNVCTEIQILLRLKIYTCTSELFSGSPWIMAMQSSGIHVSRRTTHRRANI